MADTQAHLMYKGQLKGHTDWVTCLATTVTNPNLLISGSRDKTLVAWELTREQNNYGFAKKSFKGHSHFVSDVAISFDAQYVLSSSWDKTLRLWEIKSGKTTRTFIDHKKDIMSVAWSANNRQIVSAGRDRTIKLWNTLAECKYTITEGVHNDWISCVRFSPNMTNPIIISGGWDRTVKVWNLETCKLMTNLLGHTGVINSVCISPDGSLCASGGKDGTAMLWDLNKGEHLYSLEAGDNISALAFSPNRYWLCAATSKCIKIWDLESKRTVAELIPEIKNARTKYKASCVSLAWSADGSTLFSGYNDGIIRVWGVHSQ